MRERDGKRRRARASKFARALRAWYVALHARARVFASPRRRTSLLPKVEDVAEAPRASTEASDSDVEIVGETTASTASTTLGRHLRALGLRRRGVVPDGNCCFRSIEAGARTLEVGRWGIAGKSWADVRAACCDGLAEAMRRTRPGSYERRALFELVLHGKEGRGYLRRGRLRRATNEERFAKYLKTMRANAATYANTSRWSRYWGSDAEVTVISQLAKTAIVCAETSSDARGANEPASFCVAVPDLENTSITAARYYASGALDASDGTVTWISSRRDVSYVLRAVDVDDDRFRAQTHRHPSGIARVPAIAIRHHPGHFEALVCDDNKCLVVDIVRRRRERSRR